MKDVREVRASLMQKCVLTVAEVEERAMRMIALSSSSKRQLRTGDGLEAATVDGTALELYQEAVSKIDSFLTANNIDKSTFPSEENCELLGSTRGDSVNQATVKKLLDVLLSFATTANAYVVVKEWRELLPQIITR